MDSKTEERNNKPQIEEADLITTVGIESKPSEPWKQAVRGQLGWLGVLCCP
jgi:hypothetical protein